MADEGIWGWGSFRGLFPPQPPTPVSTQAAHLLSERDRKPPVLPVTNLTPVFSPHFHIKAAFVLLNCLDLRNTLLCCFAILAVLHIFIPSLSSSSNVWKFADVLFLQASFQVLVPARTREQEAGFRDIPGSVRPRCSANLLFRPLEAGCSHCKS